MSECERVFGRCCAVIVAAVVGLCLLCFTGRSAELSDLPLASLTHTHTDAKVKGPSLGHCVGVCALSPHCLLSILVFWMDVRRAAAAVTAILNSTDQNVSVAEYQKLSSTVLKASCLGFKSSCRPLLHIISCHFSTVNYQNNGNFVNNTFKKNCLFCRQKKHI